jgi:hypothetical protein
LTSSFEPACDNCTAPLLPTRHPIEKKTAIWNILNIRGMLPTEILDAAFDEMKIVLLDPDTNTYFVRAKLGKVTFILRKIRGHSVVVCKGEGAFDPLEITLESLEKLSPADCQAKLTKAFHAFSDMAMAHWLSDDQFA